MLTGTDVGTPIIHFEPPERGLRSWARGDQSAPEGQTAGELWDLVVGLARFPGSPS